ncbi:MAG TPA: hypothetical protein VJV23_02790 [Candidatus Polarisedimenticolia bacterium]|nr:hypothetical protein [Candidatus Polarisedimenticolia bacterium]
MKSVFGAAAMVLAIGLALTACESEGDPTAPADSMIIVDADPQTVIVPSGGGVGATVITATLRSKNGTRLEGQEISFSTTAGTLDPPPGTFLTTDDQGQATSLLTTGTSATVTARSGSITGMTTVQTAPGDLATFILNVDPTVLTSCLDQLDILVNVNTTSGDPAPGVLVIFGTTGELTGTFNPTQVSSDENGEAASVFSPDQTICQQHCTAAAADPNTMPPRDGSCTLSITAEDVTDTFSAVPQVINETIP